MTSFKSAQLISNSKDADKVIFLMDRIELGTQSLREYRAFAEDNEDVQATQDTHALVSKLKSNNPADTLIVTSIQKMSNIKDGEGECNARDIAKMNSKRIVFIVDEAHRSTFGDMLMTIKKVFPDAIFFGFTGTPIQKENQKKNNTTSTVFGDELHRYSIADGIRDKNVLGFDTYKVLTYREIDLRKAVALKKANSATEEEAINDSRKSEIYYHYMDAKKIKMAGYCNKRGEYIRGIEDDVPALQYERLEHREKVVEDISENWTRLSHASKFHAIFATSSIAEAIEYYRLLKKTKPELKVTALFDPNIDNNGNVKSKQDGLVEIIEDYNERYKQDFNLATHGKFKKDIAARLAHKRPYERIEHVKEKQLDILIVVDQMLTGFDSKWVNTLYIDKVLKYENVIQAFSRTNRLFGIGKPFGTIRYYRYPSTMTQNINKAVELYSGNRPFDLFVQQLDHNLEKMNQVFEDISRLFTSTGISDFSHLPDDVSERGKFAKLFNSLNEYLEAAEIQGFTWEQQNYKFKKPKKSIDMVFDEDTYLILALRYKELSKEEPPGGKNLDTPFNIRGHLTAIDTGRVDTGYMNTRFVKYLKELKQDDIDPDIIQETLNDLHKSFATLTQEEQKYANIFINDIQRGNVKIEDGKSFRDYITEYQFNAKNEQVRQLFNALGLDVSKLENLMNVTVTEANINEFGRFDDLKQSVDREKSKAYFEEREGTSIPAFKLSIKIQNLLKAFILRGGFDINEHENE